MEAEWAESLRRGTESDVQHEDREAASEKKNKNSKVKTKYVPTYILKSKSSLHISSKSLNIFPKVICTQILRIKPLLHTFSKSLYTYISKVIYAHILKKKIITKQISACKSSLHIFSKSLDIFAKVSQYKL